MKTASKRFAAWLLMLALCLTLFSMAAIPTRAAGDSGIVWNESDQRYEISDYAGLLEFAAIVNGTHSSITQNKSACAILTKDIDASASAYYEINPDYAWTPIGYWNSTSDNAKYTGTFDGRGCVITSLTYNNDNTNYVGLFGYVGTDGDIKGTVQNVGLEGGSMSGSNYVGGVVGYNFGGTMENCYNTGSVTGSSNYVGGVVGYNTGNVENCYNTGGVSGSRLVGGVVGGNIDGGTVENCYNTGSITGKDYVGGVVGRNDGTVTYCYYDKISGAIGAINGADTDTVRGLTTEDMTGRNALSNMAGFTSDVWFPTGSYPVLMAFVVKIADYDDLLAFAARVNGGKTDLCAILMNNIVAKHDPSGASYATDWTPIGNGSGSGSNQIRYTGTFDGRGHVITGLTYNNNQKLYVGLFGYVGSGGLVENVGLEDGSMSGNNCVGGVVGYNYGGTVENCYSTGSVSGSNYVGGVVGLNFGTVTNCYNTGNITGSSDEVGGVVGYNYGGTVENCYNTGSVTGSSNYVGGVVGYNYGGTDKVINCYNTGSVSGSYDVGGVVGYNTGNVENCYNTGSVSGNSGVGGVVGYNYRGTVENCYNTGGVTGSSNYVGGVVGFNTGNVENCYYDKISGAFGAINGADTDTVKGLTTAQMTGESAISQNCMNFTYGEGETSPWLVKADGADKNGTYDWFYPHLKGFAYDSSLDADDWPPKVRVTVTNPEGSDSVTYDGTEQKIDPVAVIVNAPVIPEGANVKYHQQTSNDWMVTDGAPTDPGTYRATITEEDGNTYDTYFRILEPVLDYTVTYQVKTSEDTWSPAASVINAGDYKRVITFTDDGYGAGHADIETEFSIAKKALTITAKDQTRTYTGNTQGEGGTSYEEPAQIAQKVTITGQLAEGDTLASITLNGQGTVVSETGYEIEPSAASIQNAAGDDVTANYDITYAKGTLTINAKPVTVTADSGTKVYDGKPLTVGTCTNTALAEGHSIQSVTVTGSQTEVGSSENEPSAARIVNAKGEDVTANYDITYANGTLEVTPAPVTVTPADKSKVYGDADPVLTATVTGLVEGETLNYSLSRAEGEIVGEYDIAVLPGTNPNYDVKTETGTFTITPASVTVIITGHTDTATYDGKEHIVSGYDVEISDTLYAEEYFAFTGTAEASQTDVGTAEMGLTTEQFTNINNNFNVTFAVTDGYQTVEPLDVTVTVTGAKDVTIYDGKEHSVSGFFAAADTELYDVTKDFTFSGTAEAARTDTGTAAMGLAEDQFENVNGNFRVTFLVTDGYQTVFSPDTVTVTVTGHTYAAPYDGEEHKVSGYDVEISGKPYTEADFTFSGTAYASRTDVGTVYMGLTADQFTNTNTNFNTVVFIVNDGYVTVEPRAATVTADNLSKTYGDKDPTLTATVTGLADGDELTYSVTREQGENAGTYTITPAGETEQGNYTVTYVEGVFTVNQGSAVTVTVVGSSDTADYDGNEHRVSGYTAEADSELYDVTKDFEFYGTAEASRTDAGTAAMGLAAEQFTNVNSNFATVIFEITDGYQTVSPINAKVTVTGSSDTVDYDGKEHTVSGYTAKADTELYDVTKDFAFSGTAEAARTEAGITNMGLAAEQFRNVNPNFATVTFDVTDGVLTVGNIDAVVTVTGKNGVTDYDGKEHRVGGYAVEISNPLYTEDDFTFSGTAQAARTDAGTVYMGLAAEQFTNTNANFENVVFIVTDGYQTVNAIDAAVTVTGTSNIAVYDRAPHSVSGFTAAADTALYDVTKDFTFSGTAEAARTEAGTAYMGLAAEQFVNNNPNFKNVTFEVTDGYQTVAPKEASITAVDCEKYCGEEDPAFTATVEGELEGEPLVYALSRESGEAAGEYAINVIPGENPNYAVTTNPGVLTVKEATKTDLIALLEEAKEYDNEIEDRYPAIAVELEEAIGDAEAVADDRDAVGEEIEKAAADLRSALQTAKDKTAFEEAKDAAKDAADGMAEEGDSKACRDLIEAAKTAVEALPYDESKTLGENRDAVDEILEQLIRDLAAQRGSEDALLRSIADALRRAQDLRLRRLEEEAARKAAEEAAKKPSLPFTDVSETDPFHDDVKYVWDNGIMNGTSETTFEPLTTLTRGMIVTILYRMEGRPAVPYTGVFTDVPNGMWFTDGVEWAASKGIVLGYGDGTYGVGDNVTREQLFTILYRYAQYKGYDVSVGEDTNILSWDDAFDVSDWANAAMRWACGAGIVTEEPALRPGEDATRAEIAAAVRAFLEGTAKQTVN